MLNKISLNLYRVFATVALYGILAWAAGFCGKLIFYTVNNSWFTPVMVTKQDPRVLAAAEKLFNLRQQISLAELDKTKNTQAKAEAEYEITQFQILESRLATASSQEVKNDYATGRRVAALTSLATMIDVPATMSASIDSELAAGLITKTEAELQRKAITAQQSSALHNQIQNTVMLDEAGRKTTNGVEHLSVAAKLLDIQNHISQLTMEAEVASRQMQADDVELASAHTAVELVSETPYAAEYLRDGKTFGFIPYDAGTLNAHQPVYACKFDFIICHEAGEIVTVFSNEERVQNPISLPVVSSTIRGRVVEIRLNDSTDVQKQTLFLNRPVGF